MGLEEQLNSQQTKNGNYAPMTAKVDGKPNKTADIYIPCNMYRICPNYESVCSSIQYRDNCRKKEESYWKGENNGNE